MSTLRATFRGLYVDGRSEGAVSIALKGLEKATSGEAKTGQDGEFATGVCKFSTASYLAALTARRVGTLVIGAGEISSTQTFVQQNAHLLPDGTVVVADRQGTGKGRGGNKWDSPVGCLMFSVCSRLAISGQRLPFLQYVVALSVVEAARAEAARLREGADLDLRIKWPNDLYLRGLKVGGVLCNSTYSDGAFLVSVGVGINVANREPTTCLNQELLACAPPALALAEDGLSEGPMERETLLAAIMGKLEHNLDVFSASGFEPLEAAYLSRWLHSDQQVVLSEEDPGMGKRDVNLTIRGLTPAGYLLGVDRFGTKYELHPDGNSFDFFKGLVRKKI